CYLFPLPKFTNDSKYEEEASKVSKELLTIYIKERIRAISDQLKLKNEHTKEEELKKEFANLLSILPKN
ncbi:hypothetical protein M1307_02385, partial [Patescibacteria group bacterium]|nr:hypothetical protein [Patescibacteria group bacterium]